MEIKRLIRLCLACLVAVTFAAPAFAESEDAPLPGDYQALPTGKPAPAHHKAVRSDAPAKPRQPSKIKKHVKNFRVAKAKAKAKSSHKGSMHPKKPAKGVKSRHVLHKPSHAKKPKRVKRKH